MEGSTVELASNGQVGLARALDVQPEVIVTDVMMLVMDGHEFCRRLHAEPRTAMLPVIGMSVAYRPQADHA